MQTIRWTGMGGDSFAWALSEAYSADPQCTVIITPDVTSTYTLQDALTVFLPNTPIDIFPDWEILPYDHFSPHQDITSERIRLLRALPQRTSGIVLIALRTVLHRMAPRSFIAQRALTFQPGDHFDPKEQLTYWISQGYQRVPQVMMPGEVSLRGGIFDIFAMGYPHPIRIELFGEVIDELRWFDPETQKSLEKATLVEVIPAKEFPTTEESIATFRNRWRDQFDGQPTHCPIYQAISGGTLPPGIEYYIPLFFEAMGHFFEYLPADACLVTTGDIYGTAETFWKEVEAQYTQRGHDRLYPILKPMALFLTVEQAFAHIGRHRTIEATAQGAPTLAITTLPDLTLEGRHAHPLRHLESYALAHSNDRFLFLAETPARCMVIQDLLKISHWPLQPCADWRDFFQGTARFNILVGKLHTGFRLDGNAWTIIPESVLYGHSIPQRRRRTRNTGEGQAVFRHTCELQPGMAVVHHHYGVGRYQGLVHLSLGGSETDYLTLQYAGDDKIYVPVAALHLIHRYTGCQSDHIPLHKLGTEQWEKAKRDAAEKARDVAKDLLDIYAKRAASESPPLPEREDYLTFAREFPFEETPDQLAAITATLADLKKSTPMDRLICGDVGFGKTEVAMRAAFVAIQEGKQVALLVPTTLLAQQHFESFRDRFSSWPIQVAVLSRFETTKGVNTTLAGLEKGAIDLVIGTHKLIQSDIRFHALGLVIIDEEHRFGVRQKEVLRSIRANVHVLALTATPIPRTLNMALAGIRDMSIITTPPARRLSIKTFVQPYQTAIIREAILRETLRGGQAYYLYNDVQTMERTIDTLRTLVPEVSFEMAHGQMPARTLERIMSDFYHQRFQVLVCTTIIETGIDIPSANTIIIDRADKFGLAQLHQLRGRVGRSHHQAYAYCLTPPPTLISADAVKRLEALSALEDLGSGFNIATHDLEIRGAGEFLGEDQSGNIQSVGYDLYMKLLNRAVVALQKGITADASEPLDTGAEVDMKVGAFIPEIYVPDIEMRLTLYQRISDATEAMLPSLQAELRDRFGPLPEAVTQLFHSMALKNRAQTLGIDKIDVGPTMGTIQFSATPKIAFETVIRLIQQLPKQYQLKGTTQLQFRGDMTDISQRYQRLNSLLDLLSPGGTKTCD